MFEIHSFHSFETVVGIMNSAVMLVGSSSYAQVLGVAAVFGMLISLLAMVFAPQKLQGFRWLATVVLVTGFFLVPRVSVAVNDNTGLSPPRQVDNVPLGLALLGSVTSQIGFALVQATETFFSVIPSAAVPAILNYTNGGMMFGSKLTRKMKEARFTSPTLIANVNEFIHNCAVFDVGDPGGYTIDELAKSHNIWALMAKTNGARMVDLDKSGTRTVMTCSEAYAYLSLTLPPDLDKVATYLGVQLNPYLSTAAAKAVLQNQVQAQTTTKAAYQDAGQAMSNALFQQAMINSFNDAMQMGCKTAQDPACMMMGLARAQSTEQQNSAWLVSGRMAEDSLPLIFNASTTLMYILFPFIIIISLLGDEKRAVTVLGGYAAALLTIQMWPTIYAAINYLASIEADRRLAAAALNPDNSRGPTLHTADAMYSSALQMNAALSYMIVLIPPISMYLVFRNGGFASMLSGAMSSISSFASSASSSAALGNINQGNQTTNKSSMDTVLGQPGNVTTVGPDGMSTLRTPSGAVYNTAAKGSYAYKLTASASATAQEVDSARRATAAAFNASKDFTAAVAATAFKAHDFVKKKSVQDLERDGMSRVSAQRVASAKLQSDQVASEIASALGVKTEEVVSVGAFLAAQSPVPVLGVGGRVNLGATQGMSEAQVALLKRMTSEQASKLAETSKTTSDEFAKVHTKSADSAWSTQIGTRLQQQTAASNRATSAYLQAQELSRAVQRSNASGLAGEVDLTALPDHTGKMAKLQRLLDSGDINGQTATGLMNELIAEYRMAQDARPMTYRNGEQAPQNEDDVRRIAQANNGLVPGAAVVNKDNDDAMHRAGLVDRVPGKSPIGDPSSTSIIVPVGSGVARLNNSPALPAAATAASAVGQTTQKPGQPQSVQVAATAGAPNRGMGRVPKPGQPDNSVPSPVDPAVEGVSAAGLRQWKNSLPPPRGRNIASRDQAFVDPRAPSPNKASGATAMPAAAPAQMGAAPQPTASTPPIKQDPRFGTPSFDDLKPVPDLPARTSIAQKHAGHRAEVIANGGLIPGKDGRPHMSGASEYAAEQAERYKTGKPFKEVGERVGKAVDLVTNPKELANAAKDVAAEVVKFGNKKPIEAWREDIVPFFTGSRPPPPVSSPAPPPK